MIGRASVTLLAVGVAGCAAPETADRSAAAITQGSPAADDDAVVAIVSDTGTLVCTGTLIAPQIVLTAAHCGVTQTSYWDFRVSLGDDADDGPFVELLDAVVHPGFFADMNDLALIALAEPAPAAPVALSTAPLSAASVGAPIRVVGFGETIGGAGDAGSRRQGTASISSVAEGEFFSEPSPSNPCTGDSGGPALMMVDGEERLAGVVSGGDGACSETARYGRVDARLATFIQPYLDDHAPGAAEVGEACISDEQCVSGACLEAADEPAIRSCSEMCGGDDACPADLSCADGWCQFPLPTPGALGSGCEVDADCVRSECITGAAEAPICTRRCVAIGQDCPGDFACERIDGTDFYCVPFPETAGSCCSIGTSGDASGWLIVAGVIAALRRRRRRP